MNLYKTQKDDQQARISAFLHEYAFFAFSQEQFRAGLQKLGIAPDAEKVVIPISGGGFILKEKADDFRKLLADFDGERQTALADPETGGQFARDMFLYELANHEYTYTGNTEETLDYLGYKLSDIENSPQLKTALQQAKDILNSRDTD